MSAQILIRTCMISSIRGSKDGNDAYVNLVSENEDGTTSTFSLTFKGARPSDFKQHMMKPLTFKGTLTGMIWDNAQRLQAVGQFSVAGETVTPPK